MLVECLARVASEYEKRYYAARQKEFTIQDNLLYLQATPTNSQDSALVFVVPEKDQQAAIDGCHHGAGHQGRDRTLSLMKEHFWWPGMSQALLKLVATYHLHRAPRTSPHRLCGNGGNRSYGQKACGKERACCRRPFHPVCAGICHKKQHTARTARVLYNNYFSVFRFPQRLMSDQGTEFCGKVIAVMCSLLGIEKIRTTPYHAQTNGSAERVHQMLQCMIGKLDPEKRQKWPAHIRSIIIAYNSTRSLVTGYSPYYLMFGRRPRLPIDLLFPTCRMQTLTRTIDEYVASLYDRLRKSLVIAQDCAIKEAQRQKWLYDRKVGAIELRPGDNILVRLDAFRGQRRKLKNWWGSDLHMVVIRVVDGIPAYVVKNNRTGKKKVVH